MEKADQWSDFTERARGLLGNHPERAGQLLALAERLEEHGLLDHALVFMDTVVVARQRGKPLFGSPDLALRLLAAFSRLAERGAVPEAICLLESLADAPPKRSVV